MKFGWIEEDQYYDDDILYGSVPVEAAHDPQNSISTEEASSITSTQYTDSEDYDSEQEMTWDSSPIQFQLTSQITDPHPAGNDIPPEDNEDGARQEQQTRNTMRRFATSEHTLTRSHAFRQPPDNLPTCFPPQKSKSDGYPSRTFVNTRSRLPKPTNTS